MNTFKDLNLDVGLLEVLDKNNITTPTEIQSKTIPYILEGKDLIAGSATGSGKTLAFGLGVIQNLSHGQGVQVLVLTPTRELAEQVSEVLASYSRHRKLRVTAIYGGVSINPQINVLRSADIVVGTPGRILDHLERRTIDLSFLKHLILDEADRMLDMGFLDDVKKILSQTNDDRQTLLFSATLPPEVTRLAKQFMKDPARINAVTMVDPKKLKQYYYDVAGPLKFSLLAHLLKEERTGLAMVFCNSRLYTSSVARNLKKAGIDAMAIHGGLSQAERKNVLGRFHQKHVFVLVCTDVAARGLDIPDVTQVYNYDIPDESKQYIHRIGRTARAGEAGKVVNLISHRDYDNFSKVLRDNDVYIKKLEKPFIEKISFSNESDDFSRGDSPRRGRGGRDSSRGGRYSSQGNRDSRGGRSSSRRDGDSPRRFGSERSGNWDRGSSRGGDRSRGGRGSDDRRSRDSGDRSRRSDSRSNSRFNGGSNGRSEGRRDGSRGSSSRGGDRGNSRGRSYSRHSSEGFGSRRN